MKKLSLAVAAASLLGFAPAANAAITITSCTFQACALDNQATSATIGVSDISLAAMFSEAVNFTNDVAGLYSITFGSSSPSVDILTAVLTGSGGTFTLAGPQGPDAIVDEQFSLAQTFLPAGSFTFSTTGTKVAGQAGSIAGTISQVNAAVPEPATWGMMLIGFAMLGGAMRRKQRKVTTRVRFA